MAPLLTTGAGKYVTAAAGFTPASLTNIIGWFPAGTGSLLSGGGAAGNGQSVARQNDASGAGNHLTINDSGGPILRTTGFNGHTSLECDSSANKALYTAADVVTLPGSGANMSCFAAVKIDPSRSATDSTIFTYYGNGQAASWNNTASGWLLMTNGQHAAENWGTRANANFYVDVTPASPAFGTNVLIGSVYNSSTWTFYVGNGSAFASVSAPSVSALTMTGPGKFSWGQFGFVGQIADVVITNSAMDSTDRANLWTYWNTLYGVG